MSGAHPARGWLAVWLLVSGSSLLLLARYGTLMPYMDQWNAEGLQLFRPWLHGQLVPGDMVRAFNEHHIFTTRLLDILLFSANHDIWNVLAQEAVNACLHGVVLAFLVQQLSAACPPARRNAFLLAATLLLLVPVGWQNLLCSFLTQVYAVQLFSLLFLWRLAGAAPLSWRWWLALPLALLAFLSMAPAVVTLGLAAVLMLVWLYRPGVRTRALLAALILLAMAVGAFMLTPVPDTEVRQSYAAASLPDRLSALQSLLAWPLFMLPAAAALVWLPFALFLWRLRRSGPATGSEWMLLAIGLWVLAQCAGIAWGRSTTPLESRYLDFVAPGLAVNLACLLRLAGEGLAVARWRRWLLLLWSAAVMAGMLGQVLGAGDSMQGRLAQGEAQQRWIRHYLAATPQQRIPLHGFMRTGYPDGATPIPFLETPELVRSLAGALPDTAGRQAAWARALTAGLAPLGAILCAAGLTLMALVWQRQRLQASGDLPAEGSGR